MQRYKICQQFTTPCNNAPRDALLFQICKDTKFVSNSQRNLRRLLRRGDCFRYAKIQNLSAIHNQHQKLYCCAPIVSDMQRYKICQQFTTVETDWKHWFELFQICKDTKFVSNSQPSTIFGHVSTYCFRYAKIQNLSAIHNIQQKRFKA